MDAQTFWYVVTFWFSYLVLWNPFAWALIVVVAVWLGVRAYRRRHAKGDRIES
jgi:hypothetical protein